MRRAVFRTLRTGLVPAGVVLLCVAVRAQPHAPLSEPDQPNVVDEQHRRENMFTAGVLLLIGVTTVGLLLIAAAILWGAKVRRMARRPETRSARQDDLWYLRHRLPPADPGDPADEMSSPLEDQDSVQ